VITVCADPSQQYNDLVVSGLQNAAQRWECTLGEEQLSATFSYEGKKSTRLGNRPVAENTKDNYEGNYRQLWRYCVITGNYEDMLVLLSPCPKNVPSMKLETVEGFLRFKRQQKGVQLTKVSSSDPICDVFGKLLACNGKWRAPKNADIFKAAIMGLYKASSKRNTFHGFCSAAVMCQEENATMAVTIILDTHKSIMEVILQTVRSLIVP